MYLGYNIQNSELNKKKLSGLFVGNIANSKSHYFSWIFLYSRNLGHYYFLSCKKTKKLNNSV